LKNGRVGIPPVYVLDGWGWKMRRTITQSEKAVEDMQAIPEVYTADDTQAIEENQAVVEAYESNEAQTIEEIPTSEEIQPNVRLPTHKEAVETFEQLDLFSILNDEGK